MTDEEKIEKAKEILKDVPAWKIEMMVRERMDELKKTYTDAYHRQQPVIIK